MLQPYTYIFKSEVYPNNLYTPAEALPPNPAAALAAAPQGSLDARASWPLLVFFLLVAHVGIQDCWA